MTEDWQRYVEQQRPRSLGDRFLAPVVGLLADLLGWLDRRLRDDDDQVDDVDLNLDGDDVPGLHR